MKGEFQCLSPAIRSLKAPLCLKSYQCLLRNELWWFRSPQGLQNHKGLSWHAFFLMPPRRAEAPLWPSPTGELLCWAATSCLRGDVASDWWNIHECVHNANLSETFRSNVTQQTWKPLTWNHYTYLLYWSFREDIFSYFKVPTLCLFITLFLGSTRIHLHDLKFLKKILYHTLLQRLFSPSGWNTLFKFLSL